MSRRLKHGIRWIANIKWLSWTREIVKPGHVALRRLEKNPNTRVDLHSAMKKFTIFRDALGGVEKSAPESGVNLVVRNKATKSSKNLLFSADFTIWTVKQTLVQGTSNLFLNFRSTKHRWRTQYKSTNLTTAGNIHVVKTPTHGPEDKWQEIYVAAAGLCNTIYRCSWYIVHVNSIKLEVRNLPKGNATRSLRSRFFQKSHIDPRHPKLLEVLIGVSPSPRIPIANIVSHCWYSFVW